MGGNKVEFIFDTSYNRLERIEVVLSAIDRMIAAGQSDTAFKWIYAVFRIAQEQKDANLERECATRINKIRLPFKSVPYDEKGAADPQNCRQQRRIFAEKQDSFKETFSLVLKQIGETKDMINNRLAEARIILINGNYIAADTGKTQWIQAFKGITTHEKIKWTGEKGHIKYFFEGLKPYIINPQSHRLWETVAAHFTWNFT